MKLYYLKLSNSSKESLVIRIVSSKEISLKTGTDFVLQKKTFIIKFLRKYDDINDRECFSDLFEIEKNV